MRGIIGVLLFLSFLFNAPFSSRAANELHIADIKNADPKALPIGLYFHSSIPIAQRRILIDDLEWLSNFGDLKNADILADYLGIKSRPLRGEHVVAWLLEDVTVLASAQSNSIRFKVVSAVKPEVGFVAFPSTAPPRSAHDSQRAAAEVHLVPRDSRTAGSEVDAALVDDRLLLWDWNRPNIPIVYLHLGGLSSFRTYDEINSRQERTGTPWSTARDARAHRLASVIHEAIHLKDRALHDNCPTPDWPLEPGMAGKPSCDHGDLGAYGVQAFFLRMISDNCADCSASDYKGLKLDELFMWNRIVFTLRAPIEVPHYEILDINKSLPMGKTVKVIPPRYFFRAWREFRELKASEFKRWRDEVRAYSDMEAVVYQAADKAGIVTSGYYNSGVNGGPVLLPKVTQAKRDPNVTGMRWWLKAARASEDFNVPLVSMPPCTTIRQGCDWP